MKKLLFAAVYCAVLCITAAAQSGIYESYAILSINGAANKFYDMQAATGNSDFNGNNLGNFFPGSSLVVRGGQNKTFKCGGCDIFNGNFFYRVYLTSGGPSGAFTQITMGFISNDAGGCGGNQTWQGTGGTTNVLSALSTPGNYTLEVYSSAGYQFCGSGTHFSNNGGANYRATFNYCTGNTLRTAATLDCESSVIPDYGNTFINNCEIIARVVPQGASPISGTVTACVYTYGAAQRHPGSNSVYVPRVYDIEPAANAATASARITLYYTQADLDAYDTGLGYDAMPNSGTDPDLATKKAYMVLTRYSNNTAFGSFSDQGNFINPADADIVWNGTNNWWEISFDNTGFSEFYLHTGISILNQQYGLLTGTPNTFYNQLNWMAPCGTDLKQAVIQKQHNGIFEPVAVYAASDFSCGRAMQYRDHNISNGAAFYRLQLTSRSNAVNYSPVLKIENLLPQTGNGLSARYFEGRLLLQWQAAVPGPATLALHDMNGRRLHTATLGQVKGMQQQAVDIQHLQSGVYMLTLLSPGSGTAAKSVRFIKQ